MDVTVPTVESLLTVGGLTILVTALTEVILRAWRPTADQQDRFGPLIAMVIGVGAAVTAGLYTGGDLFQAVLAGVLVGWGSMGAHDTARVAMGARSP